MRHTRFAAMLTLLVLPALAQGQDGPAQVSQLVKSFVQAEQAYDSSALSKLISERFVEVAPAGEVDAHDRFLSFYAPDKKTAWPPFSMTEEPVRIFGDTAIDLVTFHYDIPGADGSTRAMEIRSSFVAKREGGTWKLLQTQHTGIRSKQAPSGK